MTAVRLETTGAGSVAASALYLGAGHVNVPIGCPGSATRSHRSALPGTGRSRAYGRASSGKDEGTSARQALPGRQAEERPGEIGAAS